MADETEDSDEKADIDQFAQAISDVLSNTLSYQSIAQRFERHFDPKPASLYQSADEAVKFQEFIQSFARKFGRGDDSLIIIEKATGKPLRRDTVRTFHIDIINELLSSFWKARSAVLRAHMYYITLSCLEKNPDWWDMSEDEQQAHLTSMESRFWDTVEIAVIRLVSYWDRVGQLLDFVFFNIRQYERDGFTAVIDRLKKNFAKTYPQFGRHAGWKSLVVYTNSEKTDGFKWLTRRRNLFVHSTGLRPRTSSQNDAMFDYEFNHYEKRVIDDLSVKSPKEELGFIHSHLSSAANLCRVIFDVAELGAGILEEEINSR